jgi:hypothetical protein
MAAKLVNRGEPAKAVQGTSLKFDKLPFGLLPLLQHASTLLVNFPSLIFSNKSDHVVPDLSRRTTILDAVNNNGF